MSLDDCTFGSLRKASRRISQFYDHELIPVGIKSTQFSILSEVHCHRIDEPLSICELARLMVMDRSTLGHNLRPLQRDGLVLLRAALKDRRKRGIVLTRRGALILARASRLWETAEKRFERTFGRQSTAELRAVLRNVATSEKLNSIRLY